MTDKLLYPKSEFRRYLSRQFSIAFDVYLQILSNVDSLVNEALHRDSPNWRLKHCCPACTYILEGETPLKFSMLYALDGNDSLKRIQRKLLSEDGEGTSISVELPTSQVLRCPRYLSREFVDQQAGQGSNVATAEVRIFICIPQSLTYCMLRTLRRIHVLAVGKTWTTKRRRRHGVYMMKLESS